MPDKWSRDEIAGHLRLVKDAGLIDGKVEIIHGNILLAIHGLSNAGHDLLDTIRNDKVWEKTKEKVEDVGGSVAIETIKAIAIKVVGGFLGL